MVVILSNNHKTKKKKCVYRCIYMCIEKGGGEKGGVKSEESR